MAENNKYFLKLIIIFVVAFILGVGFTYYFASHGVTQNETQTNAGTLSVMLDYGNDKVDVVSLLIPKLNATLADILVKASNDKKIAIDYRDYGGNLGMLMKSINGRSQTLDKYWQYWVNNVYAQVGVSSYIAKPGDVINFKLIKSQQ